MNARLRDPQPSDHDPLLSIYKASFPPEERRPWNAVWRSDEGLKLLVIDIADRPAGLLTWWNLGMAAYIEHFAVDASLRGCGAGSAVLRDFVVRFAASLPVVLEVEPPAEGEPDTFRRIDFYRRNGFHLLPHNYVQPPYAPGLPEVPLRLMSTDADLSALPLIPLLHTRVYGKKTS